MKEEKLLKIINNHGVDIQQRKLAEETFELQEAILEYDMFLMTQDVDYEPVTIHNKQAFKKHVAEEIADVMVLLEQFKLYYGITAEEITDIFWNKVDRTLERMEK